MMPNPVDADEERQDVGEQGSEGYDKTQSPLREKLVPHQYPVTKSSPGPGQAPH